MDSPIITLLQEPRGRQESLVLVKGYLSDEDLAGETQEAWVTCLREAGWRGAIYHLWWDGSNDASLIGYGSTGMAAGGAVGRTVGAIGGPAGSAAGGVVGGIVGGRLHWSKTKRRAKRTGRDHAGSLIQRQVKPTPISVMGFSLGARVVYYIARELPYSGLVIKDVYLIGGAVRRDSSKDWGEVASNIDGLLVNVYNKKDKILSKFYRTAEWGQSPCGRKEIKERHSRIRNVDARYIINSSSHKAYKEYFLETIGEYFHR